MIITTPTPIIFPATSRPNPCANCDCPCHNKPDVLAALALLFGLCLTVAGATVQWLYDPAHMVTRELPGDRVACSIFAAMASALAAIVVVGTVTIVAYIVSTLWRAFRT